MNTVGNEVGSESAGVEPVGDYALRDLRSGLIWSPTLPGGRMTWQEANEACGKLDLGGRTDWRLPTLRELLGPVDYERFNPAANPAFEFQSSWYWSSTPYAPSPGGCAWGVGFDDGGVYWDYHDGHGFVRAVCAGQ